MTKERKIEILKDLLIQLSDSANILCTCEADERCEVIEECIKVIEQQPSNKDVQRVVDYLLKPIKKQFSGDCVSRQAVLDLINADWKYEGLELSVNELPPVTPTFSKGATNGDMIKAMFPLVEVKEKNNGYEVYFGIGTSTQYFNHQWWNAPYKRGNENGSN
jgi:hypothetical protein